MMEFIKLNKNWNAEPNAPAPVVEINGPDLYLSFYLNAFIFPEYNEEDLGRLVFFNCRQYRMGPPNDEGFYFFNQSRYKKYGVEWGEFYMVKDSDWMHGFPNPIVLDAGISLDQPKHYLFYFKDETFECIAENYAFTVSKNDSRII